MEHRHLNIQTWSAATVDSALERGNLNDWRELFAAVQRNREVAALVVRVASRHRREGFAILAKALVQRLRPDLDQLKISATGL
jgi:hypothetical protein